jgi:hypothetical protein
MTTINERVQLIIDKYYSRNVTAFSRDIGVSQATIAAIVSGKMNKPSSITLTKILSVNIVKLNPDWLLTGEGEMLRDDEKIAADLNNPTEKQLLEAEIENKILRKQLAKLDNDIRELTEITAVLKYRLKNEDKNEAV